MAVNVSLSSLCMHQLCVYTRASACACASVRVGMCMRAGVCLRVRVHVFIRNIVCVHVEAFAIQCHSGIMFATTKNVPAFISDSLHIVHQTRVYNGR